MAAPSALDLFHPVVRSWFESTYGTPTPPQEAGWPRIADGRHTLILAPTGSGKTLAAFLWAINHLVERGLKEDLAPGVRVLYVSPLKALNNDIARNLEIPLQGIAQEARLAGITIPPVRAAVRTGDTPQADRARMLRHPPDILITTPESLYLILTSRQARKILSTVAYVIVDEIHAVCGNKRGVHLSLSLERLQALAEQEFVRVGLSATQRPLELVASFLGGRDAGGRPRHVEIVDAGRRKAMDLSVVCPVPDFSLLPADGVWPVVFDRVLGEIRSHRTTLIFVNNRRLAERVAAHLNDLLGIPGTPSAMNLMAVPVRTDWSGTTAPERRGPEPAPESPTVLAYHGSMSRESREQMESDLKAGRLRVVVATSALELGIDIGSVDLVIQLQSPKGIARGLQRVGRSGHLVSARSQGRIIATHREDLVESAVVGRLMMQHDVEDVAVPRNCLDVLAQQIVAMVSVEDWDVDELFDLVRRSFCYADLSRPLYVSVLAMLAGRYEAAPFRELRARISWDKVHNLLRALPGSSRLAITGGGTITDRGQFGVYLADGSTKIGEVDEEFVYETRVGDTFLLGTNVWRVTEIDTSRLTVAQAPGEPARMPFWRGEGIGRSYALAQKVGEFRRTVAERLDDPTLLPWLKSEFPVDPDGIWNLVEYLRRQREHTRALPHDRCILVEGFRDEIGDPRVVVHAPFGRRVNGLLGIVLSRTVAERTGVTPQMLYNDDGILLRTPGTEMLPLDLLNGMTARKGAGIILDDIMHTAVFGGQFRQNASRALLMPRLQPGRRTPLWLQRLHAKDLLEVARRHADFPLVIETMREVLTDVLDFEHFKEVLAGVEARTIAVRTATNELPSPFAASLLFEFMAVFMYEWDRPKADRAAQYVAVNRELLSSVLDVEEVSSVIRPEAIEAVENELQHTGEGARARSPEELMELLLRLGDLSAEEIARRVADPKLLEALAGDGRARAVQVGGVTRWIAGEEERIYRDLSEPGHLRHVLLRHIRSHAPVSTSELAGRFGLDPAHIRSAIGTLDPGQRISRGHFRPGVDAEQWAYKPTLERIHRKTIAILRKEITPCTIAEFARFLLHWQHRADGSRLKGAEGIQECLLQMEGLALPADLWLHEVLPSRINGFAPELLERAGAGVAWVGVGQGRLMPVTRGDVSMFLPPSGASTRQARTSAAERVLEYLRDRGASFLSDIRGETGLSLAAMNNALGELVWSGEVTNDLFAELVAVKRSSRQEAPEERVRMVGPPRDPARHKVLSAVRRAIRTTPGWQGRWSAVRIPAILGEDPEPAARIERQAAQLLARYGIVAREFFPREDLLPWAMIAGALQRMELRGEIRRGYFVQGLSGMQFAMHEAVEEMRRVRGLPPSGRLILVNALDPANPFGPGVPLNTPPEAAGRFSRIPSQRIGFVDGEAVALVEGRGGQLWIADPSARLEELVRALLQAEKSLTIETVNGERAAREPWGGVLKRMGLTREMNQAMRYEGFT